MLAQSGHDNAGWRLHRAFHGKILALAGPHVPAGSSYYKMRPGYMKPTPHSSELFEDLVAAGHLALWEAIKGFNVYGGFRLWTFAAKSVSGAISDASYKFRRHIAGVSRIDRWLFGHWNAAPEDLFEASKKFGLKRQPFESVHDADFYIETFRRRYSRGELFHDRFELESESPEDFRSAYDLFRKSPLLIVHKEISDIIDDAARGREIEPERRLRVIRYFNNEAREKWTSRPKKKTPSLPLLRPRRLRGPSRKRPRKNYAAQVRSAEGLS